MNNLDTRVNLGLIIKGELRDIELLLQKINSESLPEHNCKYIIHKIDSDQLWIIKKEENMEATP